jgi:hypothetical protein
MSSRFVNSNVLVGSNERAVMLVPIELLRSMENINLVNTTLRYIVSDYESYLYVRAARKSRRDGGLGV